MTDVIAAIAERLKIGVKGRWYEMCFNTLPQEEVVQAEAEKAAQILRESFYGKEG